MSHGAVCHVDVETYSTAPLKKVGAYAYAAHPATELLCLAYQTPDMGDPLVWVPAWAGMPARLAAWLRTGRALAAHNAEFEACILAHVAPLRGFAIDPARWVCTAAAAAASGLPRALGAALEAMGADEQKDGDGERLIKLFCQPRKATKKDSRTRVTGEDEPEDFARLLAYCAQDVRGEKWLHENLPALTPDQQRAFYLTLKMNGRGLPFDLGEVRRARVLSEAIGADIAEKVKALTGGIAPTQRAKLLAFLKASGIDVPDMRKATLEALPPSDLITARLDASRAGTKKLATIEACAVGGRFRGGFVPYGAHTGRHSARLVQPQNFIRCTLAPAQVDEVFALINTTGAAAFTQLFDSPLQVIGECMRGFIKPPEGYELISVDYNAVEPRILAWLAGCEGVLADFVAGVDPYKSMAARVFKCGIDEVTPAQRQYGKALVLGCGYGMGPGAFQAFASGLGLDLTGEQCETFVKLYRQAMPEVVAFWRAVERTATRALRNPDAAFKLGNLTFRMNAHWLEIGLPSGRPIRYPYAKATPAVRFGRPAFDLSFRTTWQGQWVRESTYGAKLVENIVQAVGADVMQEGMHQCDVHGWPLVAVIHDEAVPEVPAGSVAPSDVARAVCVMPSWADGLPLKAVAVAQARYA